MKRVGIAQLKSRLSEHLRDVRAGESLVILDRDRPIARIVPIAQQDDDLRIELPKPGAPRLGDLILPPGVRGEIDPVALLLEDRNAGR